MNFQTRHMLFDGGCGVCRRTTAVVRSLNWLGKVSPRDFIHDWPQLQQTFPQLDFDACMRDIHVIRSDGMIDRGFDGYRSLAWVLPVFWPILPLLYLPPVRWLGWKVYRHIADHRRACAVPK